MSELYSLNVIKKEATRLKLDISVVHPDAMYIAASPGFALMILYHMAEPESAIRKEIDDANIYNEDWMKKYSFGFVKNVEVQLFNEPPEEAIHDSSHEYYKDSSKWMTGIMDIEVTHPAWIAHVNEGDTTDSADYDPCSNYDAAEPIHPEENTTAVASSDSKEGFVPVWKYMLYEYLSEYSEDIIWLPAFGDTAYVPNENGVQQYDPENLDSLLGKYIKVDDKQAIVIKKQNHYMLFEKSDSITSSSGFGYYAQSGEYSEMVFNKAKKRISKQVSAKSIAKSASPLIFKTTVKGDEVEFEVVSFSNTGQEIGFNSTSQALKMLAVTIQDGNSSDELVEGFPLSTLILQKKNEQNIYFLDEVYSKIAAGIIKEYSSEQISNPVLPNLDEKTNDEIINEYQFDKWPHWKIRVKVSDPAWLEHLKRDKQFSYGFYWVHDPAEWVGESLTWDNIKPTAGLEDFAGANTPARESNMDAELIRSMAENAVLTNDEVIPKIAQHSLFLNAGGMEVRFERLEVAGMPMNVYISNATEGEQLTMRMKNLSELTVLKQAELSKVDLSGCIAEGTDFTGAKLIGAMLTDGFFSNANFENADLSNADFTGSDLRNAIFRNANLTNTDFEITDCSGADFIGAKMEGSSFKGAKIDGVKRT